MKRSFPCMDLKAADLFVRPTLLLYAGLTTVLSAIAEPTLVGSTSAPQSLFVFGSEAKMTLEARGLEPFETRPLSITLEDAYGKRVGTVANDGITADSKGDWKGEFPLRTDFLGFRRIYVSAGDLTLPKMGSRPKGCLTYAVFTDWNRRPKLDEKECFFGLQGGDYGKWVGAHVLYSASNPLVDPEKSKAYQQKLLEQEFPIYGTISAEYRFVKPFMTAAAVAYFESRRKDAPRMPFSIPAGDAEGELFFRESMMTFARAAKASRPGRRIYEYGLECDINAPDPETMARSLKVAYEAIHEADPEALVFAAGVSNVSRPKCDYMRRLFDLGIAAHMDGFNIHPYTPYPPDRNGFIENIRAFVRLVRERKGPDTLLIATEQGFAAPFDKEVMQMEGNVRVALILLGEGFSLHCAFWGYDFGNDHYNWFDGDYGYNYNLELKTRRWSGFTSPRPVMPALSAACLFLDGKRPVTSIEGLGATAIGYAYSDRDERCVIALWDHGGTPHEVAIPVDRDEIDVADLMGNVTRKKTQGGVLRVTLTGAPCYVLDPDPALWGHKGSMKRQIAQDRERRRQREEAARQARICSVLPLFFGEVPGVEVEVENRTSSERTYSVETRIPGIPEARRKSAITLAAHAKGPVAIPFGTGLGLAPSEIREVEVTVVSADGYRERHAERLNFLRAAQMPRETCRSGDFDFALWRRPNRFRWPVETGGPEVWMSLGWTPDFLLIGVDVHDDVFFNRWTGFDTWRGDSVQFGLAKAALLETTGNFQTDVQEEARSEITLALTANGPSAYRTETFDPVRFPADIKGSGEIAAADLPREIRVVTNGQEVVAHYRAAIPWGFMNMRNPSAGTVFRLASFANDNDGKANIPTATRWFELKGSAPKHFAYVVLGGEQKSENRPAPEKVREIGQSQKPGTPPVEWTACDWCVADRDRNVYLPGGWRIRRNSREAEKCVDEVGGHMFSDGCGNIWSWDVRSGDVTGVNVDGEGLKRGRKVFTTKSWENYCFFVAPPDLKVGFAARARFGRLHRYRGEIRGYDAAGNDVGTLLDCQSVGLKNPVCAGFHPQTGDLLVGNEWPDRHVHRFAMGGQEVLTGVWPYPAHTLAINSVDGKEIFFSGAAAERQAETLVTSQRTVFGSFATETHALADGGDGWWLATTQGAQHYSKRDPSFCDRRIGGVARADRIGIKDGQVLVADGKRLFKFWLDAESDEPPCSTERARVSEQTMPEDLPTETGGWRVDYDAKRKAIRVEAIRVEKAVRR